MIFFVNGVGGNEVPMGLIQKRLLVLFSGKVRKNHKGGPPIIQRSRLKKRKLMLKDRIHKLKSLLIPDLDA